MAQHTWRKICRRRTSRLSSAWEKVIIPANTRQDSTRPRVVQKDRVSSMDYKSINENSIKNEESIDLVYASDNNMKFGFGLGDEFPNLRLYGTCLLWRSTPASRTAPGRPHRELLGSSEATRHRRPSDADRGAERTNHPTQSPGARRNALPHARHQPSVARRRDDPEDDPKSHPIRR